MFRVCVPVLHLPRFWLLWFGVLVIGAPLKGRTAGSRASWQKSWCQRKGERKGFQEEGWWDRINRINRINCINCYVTVQAAAAKSKRDHEAGGAPVTALLLFPLFSSLVPARPILETHYIIQTLSKRNWPMVPAWVISSSKRPWILQTCWCYRFLRVILSHKLGVQEGKGTASDWIARTWLKSSAETQKSLSHASWLYDFNRMVAMVAVCVNSGRVLQMEACRVLEQIWTKMMPRRGANGYFMAWQSDQWNIHTSSMLLFTRKDAPGGESSATQFQFV